MLILAKPRRRKLRSTEQLSNLLFTGLYSHPLNPITLILSATQHGHNFFEYFCVYLQLDGKLLELDLCLNFFESSRRSRS